MHAGQVLLECIIGLATWETPASFRQYFRQPEQKQPGSTVAVLVVPKHIHELNLAGNAFTAISENNP